ncbi:MAG TPA: methylmalonyl Co-A mutase-associated GTPase MeaB [Ottowia sp.]|uniref:methylmalonyl Co-A mutase-associated GTPase MeaB n=1 Tax=Ottowia sp. TaxID=1898956 RepID=UPI002CCCE249|nr:methylmalonyl Co-A mutase-associated GTPase MeaB [Ottowia sp.]HMN21178.1 methylmalonyl Co-A mutase-associated GTPase MeaB [Ottowia sp.]
MSYIPSSVLLEQMRAGNTWALGRLISRAEAGVAEVRPTLAEVYRSAGSAQIIGLTGVPGSGKSTLVGKLAAALRERGEKLGIVAIDPSSPYSGGAILGDRIRMTEVANDPNVYIRSMATRGATGGMARAALDAADLMDVAGYHTIVVETVGVGQDEVEIAHASDTTVVVSAPGLGDEIQAIKAGVLEIADIHVVSKCDRDDAGRTLTDLKRMLALEAMAGTRRAWTIPVVGVSSYTGQGIDELLDRIAAHRAAMAASGQGAERRRRVAEFRLQKTAETLLLERFGIGARAFSPPLADRLANRAFDPYAAARELITQTIQKEYANDLA